VSSTEVASRQATVEDAAAVRIQAAQRGRAARHIADALRAQRLEAPHEEYPTDVVATAAREPTDEVAAAVRIQATQRGMAARHVAASLRARQLEESIEAEVAEQAEAKAEVVLGDATAPAAALHAEDWEREAVIPSEREEAVKAFLASRGFKCGIHGAKKTWTAKTYPLHEAAKLGHAKMVEALLAMGADPAQRNSRGQTALERAQRQSKKDSREDAHAAVIAILQDAASASLALRGGA